MAADRKITKLKPLVSVNQHSNIHFPIRDLSIESSSRMQSYAAHKLEPKRIVPGSKKKKLKVETRTTTRSPHRDQSRNKIRTLSTETPKNKNKYELKPVRIVKKGEVKHKFH